MSHVRSPSPAFPHTTLHLPIPVSLSSLNGLCTAADGTWFIGFAFRVMRLSPGRLSHLPGQPLPLGTT